MKKAYYIDTFSYQIQHEMYDASSLRMFAAIYDRIEYRAALSSKKNVVKLSGALPKHVHYKPIFILSADTRMKRFIRQLLATFLNVYYIIKASRQTSVIINYNTVQAVYLINWISKLTGRKVLVVCHGEMQDLVVKRSTSWLFRKNISFFTAAHVKVARGLYFSVLGDSIRQNLKGVLSPQADSKMLSFDHTAIFDSLPLDPVSKNKKLVIGMTGIIRDSKGLQNLLRLSTELKSYPDIEIRLIGRIRYPLDKLQEAGLIIPEGIGDHFITREEMYRQMRQLDFVVYLFPPESYRFTASGSLFDAIDCERPILSLSNSYFQYIFSKYGSFGYLEETFEALKQRIIVLSRNKEQSHLQVDMQAIKKKLSPENIAQDFKQKFY